MNTTEPIRTTTELRLFKNYYSTVQPNSRNQLLIIFGLNTALRISDILSLKWDDVYNFKTHSYFTHLCIHEQKTHKYNKVYLNQNVLEALENYMDSLSEQYPDTQSLSDHYIFQTMRHQNQPITRVQAYRIVRCAAEGCGLQGCISCHSLRKTFGYQAWQQGTSPHLIMNIYNHSSYQVTKRYLCIEQDERDEVFKKIQM